MHLDVSYLSIGQSMSEIETSFLSAIPLHFRFHLFRAKGVDVEDLCSAGHHTRTHSIGRPAGYVDYVTGRRIIRSMGA